MDIIDWEKERYHLHGQTNANKYYVKAPRK
jgi:hypothetical protein